MHPIRYTSLGSTYNTFPGPALLSKEDTNELTTEAGETGYMVCNLTQRPIALDTPDKDTVCKPLPTDTDADTASFPTRPPVILDTPNKDTICKPLPAPPSSVSTSTPISSNKTRRYRPAYELEDERLERAGRGPSKSAITSGDSLPQSPRQTDLSTLSESLESISEEIASSS